MKYKLTINDVRDLFDESGVGNALMYEINTSEVDDEGLSNLVGQVKELLAEIESYVEEHYTPDDEVEDDEAAE